MYLKNIVMENMGPISRLDMELPFNEDGNPKPVIFVGENGTGKSILLSSIADSLYEFSKQAYDDMVIRTAENQNPFFKVTSHTQAKVGTSFSFAFLNYTESEQSFQYIEKTGNLSSELCKQKTNYLLTLDNSWTENGNQKMVSINEDYFRKEFTNKSICFFPPNRYEKPHWLNENAVIEGNLNINPKISRKLNKPIMIRNAISSNINWLLDIIVDSRVDIEQQLSGQWVIEQNIDNISLLRQARINTEEILSSILRKNIKFGLNWRSFGGSRFSILDKYTDEVISPTLDSLSTGQAALFNMFSTIIRYSDYNDINKSINLSEIEGIVIIDEVDLHLHTVLQREVLPVLLKKLPKVQFIITSHSPLFLLGMEEAFETTGFNIYSMPDCDAINVEAFSEFEKSYIYYKRTKAYEKEIHTAIGNIHKNRPIIITEGSTDWKHLKWALEKLKKDSEFSKKYSEIDVEFLEYEDNNSKINGLKLDMGDKRLVDMCSYYSRLPQPQKMIFIGDRDTDISNKLSDLVGVYKNCGNNVYSFQIPVPEHRKLTPKICIEHYYSDSEVKQEELFGDGIRRRLFIGNEFNTHGIHNNKELICEKKIKCGSDKIDIIEGSSGEKVLSIDDADKNNYAIPKTRFVDNIISSKEGYEKFNYANFDLIFDIIKQIIEK